MEFLIQKEFKILKDIKIDNFSCSNCKRKTALNLLVKGGFLSIFLVPVLPIKKDYVLTCINCNKRINKNALNHIEKKKFSDEFKSTEYKIPLKHFSGFAILMLILSFAIYTGFQVKEEEKKFIKRPKIGDVYYVKNELGWTTFKVYKVSLDSICVWKNNTTLDNYNDIKEIDKTENYDKKYGFKRKEIENLFESNAIYQVNR
ncbi:MAG: zinc-ribbon domain-containing protein [Bacteroidota bacterium]